MVFPYIYIFHNINSAVVWNEGLPFDGGEVLAHEVFGVCEDIVLGTAGLGHMLVDHTAQTCQLRAGRGLQH